LPIGVSGSVLTTDGTDPSWSNAEGKNVIYVANSGSDSNPGTQFLPFKTVYHALSQATSGDVVAFDTITGGTGGTPGTYDITQTSTNGSGTSTQARVILDGSSTPTFTLQMAVQVTQLMMLLHSLILLRHKFTISRCNFNYNHSSICFSW
jgi:hypothetical protein